MSDNPWRTQGDYQLEQKEARERHAMFQEQHKLLLESNRQLAFSHRLNILLVLATLVAAAANLWSAYSASTYQEKTATQELQKSPPLKSGKSETSTEAKT